MEWVGTWGDLVGLAFGLHAGRWGTGGAGGERGDGGERERGLGAGGG